MSETSVPMVTGLFPDRPSAERAYQSALSRGYSNDDVNLVMSDETRQREFPADDTDATDLGNKAAQGAGVGGGIGAAVGAVLGAVAAVGTSIAIPGLGVVIAGPLAAGIAGAGAGALTGGLMGALAGWGMPDDDAKRYEAGIKSGKIAMGLSPRSDDDGAHLEREWAASGQHVYRRTSAPSGRTAQVAAERG